MKEAKKAFHEQVAENLMSNSKKVLRPGKSRGNPVICLPYYP